ncbi:MAG: efflux RND transporter periplasmic adaptor subunit [Henriciella sp.]
MTPRNLLLPTVFALTLLASCGNANDAMPLATNVAENDHDHGDHEDHADDDHSEHDDHDDHDDHNDRAADTEDDHEDHADDDHSGHDDHGDEEGSDHVELSPAAAAEAGIVVSRAEKKPVRQSLSLPAELRYDADRVATVSPQLSGRVTRLMAGEGDTVSRGATLAILSSRELADLKAEYLTAASAEELARQAFEREETLFADRITSEADLQAAKAALTAARAAREGIENKLHAVGVGHSELEALSDAADGASANVSVRAPIGGIIARRTATLGASVSANDSGAPALFTIVDDSVLWADIAVYKQDAGSVQPGSAVILRAETNLQIARGEISVVLPAIDEGSRTATARMVVDNGDRRMRPGQFVTADIVTGEGDLALQVPSRAIVEVEERTSVFVPTDDGFEPRAIVPGPDISGQTVILSGLSEGERFVLDGAFTLKAQLEKDAFGDDHDH